MYERNKPVRLKNRATKQVLSSAILKSNGTDQRVTEIETLKLKDLVKDVKNRKQETLHSSGRRS